MQTIWLSPTNFVTGDPTLRVSYPFVSHSSTVVTCTATGDLKWVSVGLRLPPDVQIEAVIICYEVSNARSFISQVRLTEMTTPDHANVIHDDPSHLTSTAPATYSSAIPGLVPSGAVALELRLSFQNTSDEIQLGAVGVNVHALTERCVNSIADLKALTAGAFHCVQLLGYYAPGDGGGGEFYWDASSAEPDNGGTIIIPASNPATGRWKRLVEGPLSVKWFGAKGDAVDDTAAIKAAIGVGAGTVTFPPGAYRVTRTITISTACRLLGLGAGPGGNNAVGNNDERGAILEWAPPAAMDSMFLVTGVPGNVVAGVGTAFENLLFRQVAGNGTGAQGNAIRVGNALTTDAFKPSWTRIRNCTFEVGAGKDDWTYCIYVDGSGTSGPKVGSGIRDTWIENIRCVSGTHAAGSIYATVVGNLYIFDSLMNLENGNVTVTGTDAAHFSSGIHLNDVEIATLTLDYVQRVIAVGGTWTTLNTTANTNHSDLRPGYLVNSPNFNAGDSSLCVGVLATLGGPIWAAGQGVEFRSQSFVWRAGVQGNIGTVDDQDMGVIANGETRVLVKSTGSVNLAPGGELATTAADGFTYIPTCAGVPTGVPTPQAGSVPMVYDTASNNFYIYNSGWKKVSLT
jgi:hypothetical protein